MNGLEVTNIPKQNCKILSEELEKKKYKKHCQNNYTKLTFEEKEKIGKKYTQLFRICTNGGLDKLKSFIIKNPRVDISYKIPSRSWQSRLIIDFAYDFGHLDIVKFLLEEYGFIFNINHILIESVRDGNLDFIRYLFTIQEVSQGDMEDPLGFIKLQSNGFLETKVGTNDMLSLACQCGHLDIVKYLLTSEDVKCHANINRFGNEPLRMSCQWGQLEVAKYLLESSELKEHANIYGKEDVLGHFNLLCTKTKLKDDAKIPDIRDTFIWEIGQVAIEIVDRKRFKVFQVLEWLLSEYKNADDVAKWFAEKNELERYCKVFNNYY